MALPFVSKRAERLYNRFVRAMNAVGFSDACVFQHIGNMTVDAPEIARAISFYIRDIICEDESEPGTLAYTDILIEAYRRMFFDPTECDRYGLFEASMDINQLEAFVTRVCCNFSDPTSPRMSESTGELAFYH